MDKNQNFNIQEQFLRLDKSEKNKGFKVPLQQRKNNLSLVVSKFQDLNDYPLKLSTLFCGNESRIFHLMFDDITQHYTDKTLSGELIDSHIQKISESVRKKIVISFEQKSIITEYHSFAFNIKLGIQLVYKQSSSSEIQLNSIDSLKVNANMKCATHYVDYLSNTIITTLSFFTRTLEQNSS